MNYAAAAAAAPAPRAQAPAIPFQQNPIGMGGRYLNPAAFSAGFGGHAFARPPASAFRRQYRAYSTAILEIQQGRGYQTGGRANLMYGGKSQSDPAFSIVLRTYPQRTVVMPPSALDELSQSSRSLIPLDSHHSIQKRNSILNSPSPSNSRIPLIPTSAPTSEYSSSSQRKARSIYRNGFVFHSASFPSTMI